MEQQPPVAELLAYLGEIGYGDLYLKGAASTPASPMGAPSVIAAPRLGASTAIADPEKVRLLAEVGAEATACTRCGLAGGRTNVVFGMGNPAADLMFVGEAPGAEEDRQGLPFVGRSGELLTKIIEAIELSREQVYIANIVKCRPPGNRDPEPDEVALCRGFLERQIALIQPKVLVALGRVAAQTLLGNVTTLSRLRGHWHSFAGVPMMVTFHPAALLRNPAFKRPTWEDMQQVRDRLRLLREG